MKFKELTTKNDAELRTELTRLRKEVSELRVKLRTGQVKNVRSIIPLRRDVARILTILTSK